MHRWHLHTPPHGPQPITWPDWPPRLHNQHPQPINDEGRLPLADGELACPQPVRSAAGRMSVTPQTRPVQAWVLFLSWRWHQRQGDALCFCSLLIALWFLPRACLDIAELVRPAVSDSRTAALHGSSLVCSATHHSSSTHRYSHGVANHPPQHVLPALGSFIGTPPWQ